MKEHIGHFSVHGPGIVRLIRQASMSKPTELEYYLMLTKPHCFTCGNPRAVLMSYPHPDGWPVAGEEELQWLYLHCYSCGYDTALWKLGLPRYEKPIEA